MKTVIFYLIITALSVPAIYVGVRMGMQASKWQAVERKAAEPVPVSRSCGSGFAYGWCKP